jgi:hypothetical protein
MGHQTCRRHDVVEGAKRVLELLEVDVQDPGQRLCWDSLPGLLQKSPQQAHYLGPARSRFARRQRTDRTPRRAAVPALRCVLRVWRSSLGVVVAAAGVDE